MLRSLRSTFAAALVAVVCPFSALAAVVPSSGFQAQAVQAAPAGSFPAGLDVLPNGHVALFDGTAVVEVDPDTGQVVQPLYTPTGSVFGSFVAVDPAGQNLYFGESSNGTITRVPLGGGSPQVLATIAFNYDAAFSPAGDLFVAGAPIAFGTTQVYRVDLQTGTLDLVLDATGASGPIAFDAAGNLYYGENSASFPAPPGQQSLYRFTAAQVASAIGPTNLTLADGQALIPGLTVTSDLVIDEHGNLILSDSSAGTIDRFDPQGNALGTVAAETAFNSVTSLAFAGNGPNPDRFAPYQPAEGGTLYALSTDFFSFNDLNTVRPKRPSLTATPGSPVPIGPFTLDLAGGPPSGSALFLLGLAPLDPEAVVFAGGVPLRIGVDPAQLAATFVAPLDAQGALSLPATNPGLSGLSVTLQAAVDDGGGFLGTSVPLVLVLQ